MNQKFSIESLLQTQSSDSFPVTENYYNYSDRPMNTVAKPRRRRTAFTLEQLIILERKFNSCRYLNARERVTLSIALQLSETQVRLDSIRLINYYVEG